MNKYTFYCTFGSGQPGFPGYVEVTVRAVNGAEAALVARKRMNQAYPRWCGFYENLEELHPNDRIFRGKI